MTSTSSYPPSDAAFLEEDLDAEDRDTLTDLEPFALAPITEES